LCRLGFFLFPRSEILLPRIFFFSAGHPLSRSDPHFLTFFPLLCGEKKLIRYKAFFFLFSMRLCARDSFRNRFILLCIRPFSRVFDSTRRFLLPLEGASLLFCIVVFSPGLSIFPSIHFPVTILFSMGDQNFYSFLPEGELLLSLSKCFFVRGIRFSPREECPPFLQGITLPQWRLFSPSSLTLLSTTPFAPRHPVISIR